MTEREAQARSYMEKLLLGPGCKNPDRARMRYRVEHSLRAASVGREVAKAEALNEEALAVALLLHDVAYAELMPGDDWREHGRMGARMVRPFVESLGFAKQDEADILAGIALHVDMRADFPCEKTVMARSVCDCDNIDRFDVFRQPLVLQEARFDELTTDERIAFCDERLKQTAQARSFPLATATARALWGNRLDFQKEYFRRLRAQLEREREWTVNAAC
jgi:hypothetical protein